MTTHDTDRAGRILAAAMTGEPPGDIARREGCATSYIRRIVGGATQEERATIILARCARALRGIGANWHADLVTDLPHPMQP